MMSHSRENYTIGRLKWIVGFNVGTRKYPSSICQRSMRQTNSKKQRGTTLWYHDITGTIQGRTPRMSGHQNSTSSVIACVACNGFKSGHSIRCPSQDYGDTSRPSATMPGRGVVLAEDPFLIGASRLRESRDEFSADSVRFWRHDSCIRTAANTQLSAASGAAGSTEKARYN